MLAITKQRERRPLDEAICLGTMITLLYQSRMRSADKIKTVCGGIFCTIISTENDKLGVSIREIGKGYISLRLYNRTIVLVQK